MGDFAFQSHGSPYLKSRERNSFAEVLLACESTEHVLGSYQARVLGCFIGEGFPGCASNYQNLLRWFPMPRSSDFAALKAPDDNSSVMEILLNSYLPPRCSHILLR